MENYFCSYCIEGALLLLEKLLLKFTINLWGTYHEIYEHYLIVRRIKNEILCIYIRTFVGHISLYRVFEVHYFLKWFKSLSAHKIGLNPLMR